MSDIDIGGVTFSEEEARAMGEWLSLPEGRPFWKWLAAAAIHHHGLASKPPIEIMALVASQRHLSAENAFEQVSNFPSYVREVVETLKKPLK